MCIIMLLASCGSPTSKTIEDTQEINAQNYKLYDFAIDENNNIYISDKTSIKVLDKSGKEISSIMENVSACTNLAAAKDVLYIKDDKAIKTFDYKGRFIKELPIKMENVTKMACIKNNLLFLQMDYSSGDVQLSVYNIESDKIDKIDVKDIATFTPYKDGDILITVIEHPKDELKLIQYDLDRKSVIQEYESSGANMEDVCYDEEDDTLYYVSGNSAGKFQLGKENTYSILNKGGAAFQKIIQSGNLCFIMDQKNKLIYTVDKRSNGSVIGKKNSNNRNAGEEQVITITTQGDASNEPKIDKSLEIFSKKHPETKVLMKSIDESKYNAELNTQLMSGDSELNIFWLRGGRLDYYAQSGCLLDLGNSAGIKENFKQLFEGTEQLCSYDGKLIAVPEHLLFEAFVVNTELLAKLNLQLPKDHWTWEDFFNYAKEVRKDFNGDGKPDAYIMKSSKYPMPLLSQYSLQYLDFKNKKASYDNDEFKKLLMNWKKLWDEDLIKSEVGHNPIHDSDVLFNPEIMSLYMGDNTIIYPPLLNEKRFYSTGDMGIFCINAKSKNQGLCSEFLEIYLSKDVQSVNPRLGFCKDISIYNDKAKEKASNIEKEFTQIMSGNGIVSNTKNCLIFETMFKNLCREHHHPDLTSFILDTLDKFLSDQISVDETASLIDKKAQMIVGE